MIDVSLVAWLVGRCSFGALASGIPFKTLFSAAISTTNGADPTDATNIAQFFTNLSSDIVIFALAMAGFFFGLSALFYMASGATGNERARQHSISSLYAALSGLALALLAGSIAALVSSAAGW